MPPTLPHDRALALAASLRSLRHLWLAVECCGTSIIPLRTLPARGTLADVALALRCKKCGDPARRAVLLDNPAGDMAPIWGGREPWRLVVLDAATSDRAGPRAPSGGPPWNAKPP